MIRSQSSAHAETGRQRKAGTLLAAFVIGLPLAAGLYYAVFRGPLQEPLLQRYLSHPIEAAVIVLFFLAASALTVKLFRCLGLERLALRRRVLPIWDGKPAPVSQAALLRDEVDRQPHWLRNTWVGCRLGNVLDFLASRGAAEDLDDQLRTLADNDALALESSYSFTRFLAWAIPILGFLGTVLGITEAVAGVTPEKLEQSLSTVTDGLALAFDTTALALALVMVVMFLSFLVERAEQGVLESVDRYVDRELAHRFERTGSEGGQFVAVVRQNTDVLVEATEKLVQRQAAIWAKTLEDTERRRAEADQRHEERFTKSLETALERTLEAHSRRLAAVEKQTGQHNLQILERLGQLASALREQQGELAQAVRQMSANAELLARLQDNEQHLLRLQELLQQNLATLAGAGTFEEAVGSLTAAIHLLTARAGTPAGNRGRPGAAA